MNTGMLDNLHSGGNGKFASQKNGKVALRGTLQNGLYFLDGETVTDEVCQVEAKSNHVPVWHSRLGHMSYKNLQMLVKEGVLKKKEIGNEFLL